MRSLLALILSLLVVILSGCGDTSPIIIGFSGQLTGKMSDLGVYGRNGAALAIESINAAGGINGRPLKLIARDDKTTPETALAADTSLIHSGAIAIIGHMTSSQTMAALPFVEENGVVMISPTTTTPALTDKVDSFFRVILVNTVQSRELATYAHSALGVQSAIAVAESDNRDYSFSFTAGFAKAFEKLGGRFIKRISYSSSETNDWNELIDTLQNEKPDALLLTVPAHDAVNIIQKVRTAGLNTRILSGAWAYTEELLKWGGSHVEGTIYAIDYTADNPSPAFIKFRESYKNRFGNLPNFASAFSYEAVLALAEGLKKTGGSQQGLADAMAPSGMIEGVIGPFELNEYGEVSRSIFIVTVQDGDFRTVEMR